MCHDCVKVQHPERVGDRNSYNRFAYMKIVLGSIVERARKMSPRCIAYYFVDDEKLSWDKSWVQIRFDTPGTSDPIVQSICIPKFKLFYIKIFN